jgi:nitroreductase
MENAMELKTSSFQEIVRARRSVRKFEAGKMVGRDVLERIVDCGRWAP